jgi:hypothetical protein
MNGFTEHQASGASEASGPSGVVLTWATAQSMLPLVRQIVADIVQHARRLEQLRPEKDRLDRARLSLDWAGRSRRYQVSEEILQEESRLQEVRSELDGLGVALVDAEVGQVGFPTIVNNRRAYFSWRPSDEGLDFWHFVDSGHRRAVPPAWKEPTENRREPARKPRRNH